MEGEGQRRVKDGPSFLCGQRAGGDGIRCNAGPGGAQRLQWEPPSSHPRAAGAMSGKLRIKEGLGNAGLGVDRNCPVWGEQGRQRAAESPQKAQQLRQMEAESGRPASRGTSARPHWCRQWQDLSRWAPQALGETFRSLDQHDQGREGGREAPGAPGTRLDGAVSDPAPGGSPVPGPGLCSPASDFPTMAPNSEGLSSPVCKELHSCS